MLTSFTSIKLNDSQMALRSVVNHHLGQQEAHYRLTIQVTETLFCKCNSSNFLCERLACCSCIPQGIVLLRGCYTSPGRGRNQLLLDVGADSCQAFSTCLRISCENREYSLDSQQIWGGNMTLADKVRTDKYSISGSWSRNNTWNFQAPSSQKSADLLKEQYKDVDQPEAFLRHCAVAMTKTSDKAKYCQFSKSSTASP